MRVVEGLLFVVGVPGEEGKPVLGVERLLLGIFIPRYGWMCPAVREP